MNKDELERLVAAAEVVQQKRGKLVVAEATLALANERLRDAQNAYAIAYRELQDVVLGKDVVLAEAEDEA